MLLADDLDQLLMVLPKFVSTSLLKHPRREFLIEVVLDIGRRPEARFSTGTEYLSYQTIVWQDIDSILKKLGKFSGDNRAGIEKTLHRISSIRNRNGSVIGLTCRIGRAVFGTVSVVRDLLEQKKSILLLGRPGVGKTTAIREIARVLSDGMKKRVIIIDTSNEIAGDGDLPHPSIGKARRMQVSNHRNQHEVMIEAVENHMPEIIIIDEIGTELEALAARTIAERGVQLVGTVHGNTMENLIKNPTVSDLLGGIQYVTLGDEEAKRRGSSKSILERQAPPTFEVVVEIHDTKTWIVHDNVEVSVDAFLQSQSMSVQKRLMDPITPNLISCEIVRQGQKDGLIDPPISKRTSPLKKTKGQLLNPTQQLASTLDTRQNGKVIDLVKPDLKKHITFIYIYGLNNQDIKSLIKTLQLPIIVTKEIQYADAILALANLVKNNRKLKQISHSKKITIHTLQSTSLVQIAKALRLLAKAKSTTAQEEKFDQQKVNTLVDKELLTPLEEVRLAIEEIVIPKNKTLDLLPRTDFLRKQQHELATHYQLRSVSVGNGNKRRVRIFAS